MNINKLLGYIFLAFAAVPCLLACSEEKDLESYFESKPFALITANDGENKTISANVDDHTNTIDFSFSNQADISAMKVSFQLNPGFSMVSPSELESVMDLSENQTVIVSSKDKEITYTMSAVRSMPILSASFEFRGSKIEGGISNQNRTITFHVNSIYASEYPELLLSEIPLTVELSDNYTAVTKQTVFDLSKEGSFEIINGQSRLSYKLVTDVNLIKVKDYLSEFKFKRGVNLSYWMVVDGTDRDWLGYIDPKAFPLWKELGFDHFRVPVSENVLFNEDGSLHELAVTKLHEFFDWCEQNGMYAILDMHQLKPREGTTSYREEELFGTEYPEFRAHFVNIWSKISEEFKRHSLNYIAYELLNEPHDGTDNAGEWNKLQKEVLTAVRAQDPERIVFVPSMGWQDYNYINYADAADGDPNIVVSYHYYLPMLLSHYKMLAWVGYQGAVQYPGRVIPTKADADKYPKYSYFYNTTYNADRIKNEMTKAAVNGTTAQMKIHCGEFGCSKNVTASMRLQWFTDMIAAFDANNIPWTLWESLGGGFGFVDEDGSGGNRINVDLLKILTGKELTAAEAKAILDKFGFKTY